MAKPPKGLRCSRPVSRILSRVTIPLGSYPGPRRAASTGPVRLAPDGVWQAAASPRRWWALTPPFHPYRWRLRRSVRGGVLSVPLSVGFRRLACASVLPFGVRTFLDMAEAMPRPPGLHGNSSRASLAFRSEPPASLPRRCHDREGDPDGGRVPSVFEA